MTCEGDVSRWCVEVMCEGGAKVMCECFVGRRCVREFCEGGV